MVLGAQYDMLLTGPYTEETVIEFLYKYTAHNNQGDQIWESRVSRWYCFLPPTMMSADSDGLYILIQLFNPVS
jgi:hypothetical protein